MGFPACQLKFQLRVCFFFFLSKVLHGWVAVGDFRTFRRTEFWCQNRSVDLGVIIWSEVWIPRADNQTSGTQHWHVCLLWETQRTETSGKVRLLRFEFFFFNAQMAEAASDVTTSCLWIPSECVILWCLTNVLAFILSYEAHVAQQRGFIPSEMVLAPGEVYYSQMAGSCFLLVGWRKDLIFTPGPDSEGHLICLLINCNKQGVSK